MILRLPGLIAKLASLDGVKHRTHLLVEVHTQADLDEIATKLYRAWRANCHGTLKHRVKKSLESAEWNIRKATNLLEEK